MASMAVTRSLLTVFGLLLVAPLTLGRPLDGAINRVNLQSTEQYYIGFIAGTTKIADLLLEDFIPSQDEVLITGRTYYIGTLQGANAVITYPGSHPVNVATGVQVLIDNFPIRGIISVGNAGSTNENELEIGDVAAIGRIAYTGSWKWQAYKATGGDLTFGTYNAPKSGNNLLGSVKYQKIKFYTPRGSSAAVINIPVPSEWLEIASELKNLELDKCLGTSSSNCLPTSPRVKDGQNISSSSAYVKNAAYRLYLRNEFDTGSVDTGSSAVGLASWSNGVNFVAFRGISNYAGGSGPNSGFGELGAINAVKAAKAFVKQVGNPNLVFEY